MNNFDVISCIPSGASQPHPTLADVSLGECVWDDGSISLGFIISSSSREPTRDLKRVKQLDEELCSWRIIRPSNLYSSTQYVRRAAVKDTNKIDDGRSR
jgi:hypothetical protein